MRSFKYSGMELYIISVEVLNAPYMCKCFVMYLISYFVELLEL